MRPEFGEIIDIGATLNAEQLQIADELRELKRLGIPLAVSWMSGTSFWRANYNPDEWGWLKDYRSFRIEEPSCFLVEE